MKLNTIKQLILRFVGGGKIQIPTKFLKSVDIESPDMKNEIIVDDITPELFENEDIVKKINNYGLTDEEIRKLSIIANINDGELNFERDEDLSCCTKFSQCVILSYINETWNKYNYNGNNSDLFDCVKNIEYLLYYSGVINQDQLEIEDNQYNFCTVLKKEDSDDDYISFVDVSSSFEILFDRNFKPMVYVGVNNM